MRAYIYFNAQMSIDFEPNDPAALEKSFIAGDMIIVEDTGERSIIDLSKAKFMRIVE